MKTKKGTATKSNGPKKIFGGFDPGVIPTIACFNKADTPMGVDLDTLIKAMQVYVDEHVAPVWGTPARLIKSTDYVPDAWAMVFLDDSDDPDFSAYHELTPEGLPLSKVFVRTTIDADELVSVAASHELVEMLVDPAINMYTTGPKPKRITDTYTYSSGIPVREMKLGVEVTAMYAYESADPVEDVTFKVNGVDMSDFVYPAYFEEFRKPYSVKFDHKNRIRRPFQLLPGGYQTIFVDGQFTNVFGSKAKEKRFAKEDRRGHRSELRKLGTLVRSE
jgi:hypothetical protein